MNIPYHAMHPEWRRLLKKEINSVHMTELNAFIAKERSSGKEIYPESSDILRAFIPYPPNEVKVVVVGQDPYHNPGQAHGLSFSVPKGIKTPPSLRNIFKELKTDIDITKETTDLTPWAEQGVLLLNSMLTVEKNKPGSHQKKGWEKFTDKVLKVVDQETKHCVFILWGSYAQKKGAFLNQDKHLILKSAHPSPLSAYRGFFGSQPFSKTNVFLKKNDIQQINWS